ncbi:MAG: hypothetical protein U0836_09970 [Pirellulales bacterium]
MTRFLQPIVALALLLAPCALALEAQEPAAPASKVDAAELERQELLEGRRWRRVRREFHDWLAIQQIYDADEVAQIKEEIDEVAADMTAPELLDFMDDLEDRLDVLMSPEAAEARRWLNQFLAVQAKYTDEELRARRPDLVNMTAGEIRREIEQLQRRRGGVQQSQAAFDRARTGQIDARRTAAEAPRRPRPERAAADPDRFRSRYAPVRNEPSPAAQRSNFWVDPYGRVNRWGWGL